MFGRHASRISKFLSTSVIVLVLTVLSACAQSATPTTPTFTNSTPIKIGFSYSTKGDFNADGPALKQGYELWAKEINAQGGLLGRQVVLDEVTDNSDPDVVKANYTRLITKDKVDLVFGPFSTLLTKAAAQIADKYNYALLEGAGGGPSVYDLNANTLRNHIIFAVSVPVVKNLDTFAYYLLSLPQDQRPTTAAYATENADPFTQPQVDEARARLTTGGIKKVSYQQYDPAQVKDYAPLADQIIASNAQVVVLGTLLPDLTGFIKEFQKKHYNPRAIIATAGPDAGSDFVKAVGLKATEGVFVPNGWYPTANTFQNAQMVNDYIAQYGGTANAINADTAEAYSVGQVLQQAATVANSVENGKLMQVLRSNTFNTVQGPVQFKSDGENELGLAFLFQWQHGGFLPVYPSFAASVNPEFPKASWS